MSIFKKMADYRRPVTGEGHQLALQELQIQASGAGVVPRAETGQAGFEASVLDLLGQLDISLWRTGAPVWGFTRLTPRAGELVAEIDRHCLIDVIKELMPSDAGPDQVYGCPGLRPKKVGNGIALYRPGLPGRLVLRISMPDWKKAAAIAREEISEDYEGQPPTLFWMESPRDWHPKEREYVAGRHAADGAFFRNATALSVLFRHILVWNQGEDLDYTKLWTNGAMHDGHAYPIHVMWSNGPDHKQILDLLHDPIFRTAEQHDRLLERCRCAAGKPCSLIIRLATGNKLFLRRDTEPVRLAKDKLPASEYYQDHIRRRAQACAKRGLPGPLEAS